MFYVSFPSVKESVGLELLEAFHDYCQKHGLKTFELKKRISNEGKPPRWDEKFVSNELEKLAEGELERVWVCGPPVMNETFDRVLSSPQCSVPKDKFEIL